MPWPIFFILVSAHFLALLSPGPDFFLLLNHSLSHGRGAAYRTALGIACANGVFILAAIFGVDWLRGNKLAYVLMYWGGCVYLAWLAWQFWRAKPSTIHTGTHQAGSDLPAFFMRGFASGILNPKNAMFYLTLFAVLAGRDSTAFSRGLAGVWMFFAVLVWDCLVSWLFAQPRLLTFLSRQQALLHRGCAGVLWGIAMVMVWRGAGLG